MSKIKEIITYYQKKIDRHKNEDDVIIDSIHKIAKLPVTAELLQETGINNIMNLLSLRGGRVGEKALPVYAKWKFLLAVAQKDKDSPALSPEHVEEKTPSNNSCSYSKSSADSNVSHCSRGSGRSASHFEVNLYDRREHPAPERNRYGTSSSDLNGVANTDGFHQDDDGTFNPHLSIDNSEKSLLIDDCADQNGTDGSGSKSSKIQEPYHIEMKEGMFKAVKKMTNNSLSSSRLKVCEYIHREITKGNLPFKADRDEYSRYKYPEISSSKGETSSAPKTEKSSHRREDRDKSKDKSESVKNGTVRHDHHRSERSGVKNSQTNSLVVDLQIVKQEKSPHSSSAGMKRKLCLPPEEEGGSSVKRKSSPSNVVGIKEGPDLKRKSSPRVTGSTEKRKSSSPLVTGDKETAKKKSSSSMCATGDKSIGREKDRKHDSTSDSKMKIKQIKEEKKSPSHVPTPPFYPETHLIVCDKKTPIKIESPDSSSMRYISSKKERRAIYSGKRSAHDVLSLQQSCVRVLRKNLDSLKSTRKVPYRVLKPLLELLNPMQLYKIEEQNKYLLKYSDELWKQHCSRDYRTEVPGKGETWRTVYYKAYKEQSRKLKNLTASISAAASKAKPDRQAKLTIVDSLHDPHRRRSKANESPIPTIKISSPMVASKPNPCPSTKTNSPNIAIKSNSPVRSKPPHKEHKSPASSHKTTKKADAPLMSKVKKTMGHMYRSK